MVNPWALTLPLLLIAVVVYRWRKESRTSDDTVLVAHTLPGRMLPRYQARIRQLRFASLALLAILTATAITASVLVARPHTIETRDEQMASRDIVLCLDVSGSVIEFDADVMEAFAAMVDDFRGERIALVIWNSNSQVVFPLTNDYDLVEEKLLEGAAALQTSGYAGYPDDPTAFYDFTAGTYLSNTGGASLVGDGLVNCALQFDLPEEERSRTILLATDNEVSGEYAQIYTLPEAVDFAAERNITIHGMYIETYYGTSGWEALEMQKEIEDAGGHYFVAGDNEAAAQLLDDIEDQQAADLNSDPTTYAVDTPGSWPILAAAGVAILVLVGWKYRI